MRRTSTLLIVCGLAATAIAWTPPAEAEEEPDRTRTVTVDCSRRGASIAKALQAPADDLVIEISGFCRENVEIRRDRVTLRGASGDPLLDGIEGVSATPAPQAVVVVRDSERVSLENLTVRGGARAGLAAFDSPWLTIEGCRLVDNERAGVFLSGDTSAGASLSHFSTNQTGVQAVAGATFTCYGCTVEENLSHAVTASQAAQVFFWAFSGDPGDPPVLNRLAGAKGVYAVDGAHVTIRDGEIDIDPALEPHLPWAAATSRGASVTLTAVTFNSFLYAMNQSIMYLEGSTQTSVPAGQSNQIRDHSYFRNRGGVINGPTELWEFSTAIMYCSDAVLAGDLSCHFGGDAMAGSEVTVTGAVTGCPSWVP